MNSWNFDGTRYLWEKPVRFGSTSNYTEIDGSGKVVFAGTAGLAFGEIYAENNSTATTISVAGTWYQVTIFNTNGQSNNTTPDHTNDHITITKAGMYFVSVALSLLSGAGAAFVSEGEVKTNNGTVAHTNVHMDRALSGGGGDVGSASMSGIIDLAVSDTVEVWIRNKTNTTDITVEDINLTIMQIAGT